jgi:hypothetical protein
MKFNVLATKAYLEDGSLVKAGIINATGKKAEMLSKLCSRTIEILESNDEPKEIKKDYKREESEESSTVNSSSFKKKIRN